MTLEDEMGVNRMSAEKLADIDPEIMLLEPRDTFDEALVGYIERCGQDIIACYDYNMTIDALMAEHKFSGAEAQDWFYSNIIQSWAGHRTPCFLFRGDRDD